jgi:hypothetical protein
MRGDEALDTGAEARVIPTPPNGRLIVRVARASQ